MALSTTMLLLSVPFAIVGLAGIHMVQRRRFYRRNQAGIEGFQDYRTMVATRAFESIIEGTSRLCVTAAIGLVCMFGMVRCSENNDFTSSGAPVQNSKRRHGRHGGARSEVAADSRAADAHDRTAETGKSSGVPPAGL